MGNQKLDSAGRVVRAASRGAAVGLPIVPAEGPVARQDLITREIDGEFVLYDKRARSAHRLNGPAAQVWSLCDGTRSTATIASSLAARGVEDASGVVAQALNQFERARLLEGPATLGVASVRASRRTFMRWGTAAVAASAVPVVISIAAPSVAHAQSPFCETTGNPCANDDDCKPLGAPANLCKCCLNPNYPIPRLECRPKPAGQGNCPPGTAPSSLRTQSSPTPRPASLQSTAQPSPSGLPEITPKPTTGAAPTSAPTAAPVSAPTAPPSSGPLAPLPSKPPGLPIVNPTSAPLPPLMTPKP